MRTCNPRRNVGNGMEAKSGRGDSCEQSPTNDFLTLSVGKPGGGSPCDGPCWSRAFNVETGATRAHVPPSNIEGADRTRATRLPSLLYPLLRPLVVLFRSFPWTLVQTDAASFLAGCHCSYFAPLPRSAGLSPAALGGVHRSRPRNLPLCRGSGARTGARSQGGASLTSATPAPLAVGACASRTRGWLLSPARRTCFLCGMGARTVLDGVLFVRVRPVG